jgi:hypothetical protein
VSRSRESCRSSCLPDGSIRAARYRAIRVIKRITANWPAPLAGFVIIALQIERYRICVIARHFAAHFEPSAGASDKPDCPRDKNRFEDKPLEADAWKEFSPSLRWSVEHARVFPSSRASSSDFLVY